ncbi:hypothetical protein KCV04_g24384, partial [Aureobasidium melanogenum]
DPEKTTLSGAGAGSSFASTSKITTKLSDGTEKQFFMKTGSGKEASVMFEGEHASLSAIHNAVPSLCPQSYGHGTFTSSPSTHFLVTDFVDLRKASKTAQYTSTSTTRGIDSKVWIPGYDVLW